MRYFTYIIVIMCICSGVLRASEQTYENYADVLFRELFQQREMLKNQGSIDWERLKNVINEKNDLFAASEFSKQMLALKIQNLVDRIIIDYYVFNKEFISGSVISEMLRHNGIDEYDLLQKCYADNSLITNYLESQNYTPDEILNGEAFDNRPKEIRALLYAPTKDNFFIEFNANQESDYKFAYTLHTIQQSRLIRLLHQLTEGRELDFNNYEESKQYLDNAMSDSNYLRIDNGKKISGNMLYGLISRSQEIMREPLGVYEVYELIPFVSDHNVFPEKYRNLQDRLKFTSFVEYNDHQENRVSNEGSEIVEGLGQISSQNVSEADIVAKKSISVGEKKDIPSKENTLYLLLGILILGGIAYFALRKKR